MPESNKNSGVVLARSSSGESSLKLTLFLKNIGIIYALAPGAVGGRTRFGGGTEPFVWGVFNLRCGKNNSFYLTDVDIADDMINLRRRPAALLTAVKWGALLKRNLISANPDNELLANLYWNMKILCCEKIPVELVQWRFIYKWLMLWGVAPEINIFCSADNFNNNLLINILNIDAQDIINSGGNDLCDINNINIKFFNNASRRAEKYLRLNN